MSCSVVAPNGANKNCINYMQKAVAMVVMNPSFNWATLSAVDNVEGLRELIQETRDGFVVEFNGTEPAKGELVTETTGFGVNYTSGVNAGSMMGYVKTNPCDFLQALGAFDGGVYRVGFFLDDGSLFVADKLQEKESRIEGFEAQIMATDVGVPGQENQNQGFALQINFQNAKEFRNYKIIDVNYSFNDLIDYIPLGLTAEISTAWDGLNEITLAVGTRCVSGSEKSGVMTVEIIKATQGIVAAGTATDNGDGTYTVVIQKAALADLAVGEYVYFALVSKTGDVYDEITNTIKVSN